MESHSVTNCIQCSERSAQLLKEQNSPFPIFPRGEVNVKGKGGMHCFWVNAKPTTATTHGGGSTALPSSSSSSSSSLDTVMENEQSEISIGVGDGVSRKDDLDLAEQGCIRDDDS